MKWTGGLIGLMALAIIILSVLLYRSGKISEGVTITKQGDTAYRSPVTSNPIPTSEIRPVLPQQSRKPIIVYLKDSSGVISIDTMEIIARYSKTICELDSLLTELKTVRFYSDTVSDTSAKVRAVIKDQVTDNRLQAGRQVLFMNYRPISMKIVTLDRKGAFLWGLTGGYSFMGDPLFGVNMDYITVKNRMIGVTLGTGFLIPGNRFILLRYSQKL